MESDSSYTQNVLQFEYDETANGGFTSESASEDIAIFFLRKVSSFSLGVACLKSNSMFYPSIPNFPVSALVFVVASFSLSCCAPTPMQL